MKIPKLDFSKEIIETGFMILSTYKAFEDEFKELQNNPEGTFKNQTLDDFFCEVVNNEKNVQKMKKMELDIYEEHGFNTNGEDLISLEDYKNILAKIKPKQIVILHGIMHLYGGPKMELHELLHQFALYYQNEAKKSGRGGDFKKLIYHFDAWFMEEARPQIEKANPDSEFLFVQNLFREILP